ncbi:MAG TPA: IPTL-CTERM sorting domain-containing protein [Usitatibacter sp.]
MNAQTAFATQSQHVVRRVAEADSGLSRNYRGVLASLGFLALACVVSPAWAQIAPPLGSNTTFGIVSDTSVNSNTAPQTIINGSMCCTTCTAPIPLTITGGAPVACNPLTQGPDFLAALGSLNAHALLPSCNNLGVGAVFLDAVDVGLGPGIFPPGCYTNGGAMNIVANGIVHLRGAGVYIFKPNGALNTQANSSVVLENGACAGNVFWAPTATTLGANAAPSLVTPTFQGNILDPAGISIGHFANLTGRALAFGVTVGTDANTITVPVACAAGGLGGGGIPALSEWAMIMLAALLAIAGFVAMRRQAR